MYLVAFVMKKVSIIFFYRFHLHSFYMQVTDAEVSGIMKSSTLRRLGTDSLLRLNYSDEDVLPHSARESLEERFQISWDKFYHVYSLYFPSGKDIIVEYFRIMLQISSKSATGSLESFLNC